MAYATIVTQQLTVGNSDDTIEAPAQLLDSQRADIKYDRIALGTGLSISMSTVASSTSSTVLA